MSLPEEMAVTQNLYLIIITGILLCEFVNVPNLYVDQESEINK